MSDIFSARASSRVKSALACKPSAVKTGATVALAIYSSVGGILLSLLLAAVLAIV